MRTRHFAVLALLCAALLGGCAQGGPGSAAASGGASSPASPATPAPSGSTQPSSPAAGAMTLTGQVEAGVEPGCLILRSGGQTYELNGGDPAIVKPGARLRITGHVVDNVMSHCMQGKPFQIVEAHGL